MPRKKKVKFKKKGNVIKHLTRSILSIFKENSEKSFNYKQIAAKIGVTDTSGRNQIIVKLNELRATGKIIEADRGKFQLNSERKYHIGTVDITSNGNGYFISDDFEEDIFIPSVNLGKALQDDKVKAYVYRKRRKNKLEADIVEIIERAKLEFVGVLQLSKNYGFVVPDARSMYTDIFISKNRLGPQQC